LKRGRDVADLVMTLSGSFVPALRALRVDPTAVLRADA
jgi:ABC-type lipoprotein release transport system permease subunit